MIFLQSDLSQDGFFDGDLKFWQPKQGYRASTDSVYLAAAVPALAGQSVLELGCGAGVALGCLCQRISGLSAAGLEIQAEYLELAKRNFSENGLSIEVFEGDLTEMPKILRMKNFDHVIANPPFFNKTSHTAPADSGKVLAHMAGPETTANWVNTAIKRLKPRGILTMIHHVDSLPDIFQAIGSKAGDFKVLPIASRVGNPARRVIFQARKGALGPMRLLAPLIVHTGARHGDADDGYSQQTAAILRQGAALWLG